MAEPDSELRTGLQSLWDEGLLFDYTIEVDGHEFRAHKVVLASVSRYFKVLLTNGIPESKQDRLKLQRFSYLAVHNMIEFIYKKNFGDPKASSDELFTLSVYLQISSAIRVCTRELCKGLNPENCLDMFNLFMMHHVIVGTALVTRYIKSNIDAVLGVHKVDDLPSRLVSHIHDCLGKSEWDLFFSLKEWVNADYDNHKQHVDGLMSKVRFPLMTAAELMAVKKQDIYTQCPGAWHNLIEKAIKYHRLPTHNKVLDKSEQTQIRTNSLPVCFPVSDNDSSFHVLHGDKTWEKHEGFLAPTFSAGVVVIVVNNFLIAYNQPSDDTCMYIFDPRTLTWSEMATVLPREDFALVHHGQHLYAMGGRVGTHVVPDIICYNFQSNMWNVIPTPLPNLIHKHAACVVQDAIFVSGRKDTLAGQDNSQVHCLDLNTRTWTHKVPLLNAKSGHQMDVIMSPNKEVMIAILTHDFKIQLYSTTADQWTWGPLWPNRCLFKLNANSAIINDGNCLWLLNVTREVDPTQVNWVVNPAGGVNPNRRSKHGICCKVMLTQKNATLVRIAERFPLDVTGGNDNVKTYFTAMLSIPPNTQAVGPRPCSVTV